MLRAERGRFRHSALIAASSGPAPARDRCASAPPGPIAPTYPGLAGWVGSAPPGNASVISQSGGAARSITARAQGPPAINRAPRLAATPRGPADAPRGQTGRCVSGAGDTGLGGFPRPPWARPPGRGCGPPVGGGRAVPALPRPAQRGVGAWAWEAGQGRESGRGGCAGAGRAADAGRAALAVSLPSLPLPCGVALPLSTPLPRCFLSFSRLHFISPPSSSRMRSPSSHSILRLPSPFFSPPTFPFSLLLPSTCPSFFPFTCGLLHNSGK